MLSSSHSILCMSSSIARRRSTPAPTHKCKQMQDPRKTCRLSRRARTMACCILILSMHIITRLVFAATPVPPPQHPPRLNSENADPEPKTQNPAPQTLNPPYQAEERERAAARCATAAVPPESRWLTDPVLEGGGFERLLCERGTECVSGCVCLWARVCGGMCDGRFKCVRGGKLNRHLR